jgi:hypothetical protein
VCLLLWADQAFGNLIHGDGGIETPRKQRKRRLMKMEDEVQSDPHASFPARPSLSSFPSV